MSLDYYKIAEKAEVRFFPQKESCLKKIEINEIKTELRRRRDYQREYQRIASKKIRAKAEKKRGHRARLLQYRYNDFCQSNIWNKASDRLKNKLNSGELKFKDFTKMYS